MATAAEIRRATTRSWSASSAEAKDELFNLRFQLATGKQDNSARLSQVRKDVARMLTELRNREIAEAEGLALEELPGHKAAARRRTRTRRWVGTRPPHPSAGPRPRPTPKPTTEDRDEADDGDIDADELADEVADDDGMARPTPMAAAAETGTDGRADAAEETS